MRRSSLEARNPDCRKSCVRMSAALRGSRTPLCVNTMTSGAAVGADSMILLDAELGDIDFGDGIISQDVVESVDELGANQVAGAGFFEIGQRLGGEDAHRHICLLYTSDAADDQLCVDLGGRS